jgi:hypothetical protein
VFLTQRINNQAIEILKMGGISRSMMAIKIKKKTIVGLHTLNKLSQSLLQTCPFLATIRV